MIDVKAGGRDFRISHLSGLRQLATAMETAPEATKVTVVLENFKMDLREATVES